VILRDYQSTMLDDARAHMRAGARRVVLVAPTGAGKRMIAVSAIQTAVARGKRCGFLVHRQELLDQSSVTLAEAGVPHGVIKAGVAPDDSQLCQVASVQSLIRREVVPFDFLFADEAHHTPAITWAAVIDRQPNAFVLGFTATPIRLDGRGLANHFQAMVTGPGMRELIDQGYLADYRLYAPPPPDLTGVHTVAGEYDRAELAAAMDRPRIVGDVVSHYLKYTPHTQAICFAVNIAHSKHLAAEFVERGVKAMHVDGETPKDERRAILRDFEAGRFQVLSNVEMLGEGLDVAGIETVIGARPTKSLTVFLQQIGRGMRVKPSGQACVILDHAGNSRRHGLPDEERAWELTEDKIKLRSPDQVLITTCPTCFMVVPAGTKICPSCQTVLDLKESGEGVGRGLKHEEGELVAVDTLAARRVQKIEQRQAQTLEELIELARARGFKKGWAYHVWKARGGGRRYG
jgi:DNA repair protein RadD